jgi:nicotinamide mononucleotide transporter
VNPTELLGFVTGALCVWLAVRQNVWTFPIGLANNAVFAALFTAAGLYANAALQILFAVLGVLGWYWWLRGADGARLRVRRTPRWAWPAAAGVTVALTVAGVAALGAWTDSTVPWWDSLTTATSVVAQVMLGRKWLGSWAVWIATDVVLVGLYASQGLWLTAVLYVGYLLLCAVGVRDWKAALAPAPDPTGAAAAPSVPAGSASSAPVPAS